MAGQFVGTFTGVDSSDETKGRIVLDADSADISAGGAGRGGDLKVRDDAGVTKIHLDAGGAEGLFIELATATVKLKGDGSVVAGGTKTVGKLELRNTADKVSVSLGGGDTGDLYLRNKTGVFTVALRSVEGEAAGIWVGGSGQKGLLTLRNAAGKDTVNLGGGDTGDLYLRNKDGAFTVALRAVENEVAGMWIGGNGQEGQVVVRNAAGQDAIRLDGKAGDIVLANADCAEEFEVVEGAEVRAGTVMTISEDGRLRPSAQPYDRCVAGVVSGAGATRPAIVLGHTADEQRRSPIALAGRVECLVDARGGSIEVGDLLTTASEPGHAMRVTDPARAFGAVIGKALAPVRGRMCLIPILVALQ